MFSTHLCNDHTHYKVCIHVYAHMCTAQQLPWKQRDLLLYNIEVSENQLIDQ